MGGGTAFWSLLGERCKQDGGKWEDPDCGKKVRLPCEDKLYGKSATLGAPSHARGSPLVELSLDRTMSAPQTTKVRPRMGTTTKIPQDAETAGCGSANLESWPNSFMESASRSTSAAGLCSATACLFPQNKE
jgi:hypothetical protein